MNKILAGQWLCDGHNDMRLVPVTPLMYFFVFKIFGISLFWGRVPSVVFSLITIFLFSYLIKKHKKLTPLVILTLFLWATNYYFFIFSRVVSRDIIMVGFAVAGLCFYLYGFSQDKFKKLAYAVIASLLFAVSILVKPLALICVVAVFLQFLIHRLTARPKSFLPAFTAIFLTLLFSISLMFGFNRLISSMPVSEIDNLILYKLRVTSTYSGNIFYGVLKNYRWFFSNPLIGFNGALFLLAFSSFLLSLMDIIKRRKSSLIDSMMISLFIAAYLFLGFFHYQAPRYFLILLVPMLYFVTMFPLNLFHLYRKRAFFTIGICFVLLANIWNCVELTRYHLQPKFTIVKAAEGVKADVLKDSKGKAGDVVIYGESSSTLSLVNRFKFKYKPTSETKYFTIVSSTPLLPEKGNWVLLNKYKFLEKDLYLYKKIKN